MSRQIVRSKFSSVALASAGFFALISVAQAAEKVFLTNASGERYYIGELQISSSDVDSDFSFALANESFGDYFLSMRAVSLLGKRSANAVLSAIPYDKPKAFSATEMRPLEYDFLFIHRNSSDYGIDPWNGLYYKIAQVDGKLRGEAHAVDLNVLASPPENGEVYPLSDVDLHSVDSSQVWLPTLEIGDLGQ